MHPPTSTYPIAGRRLGAFAIDTGLLVVQVVVWNLLFKALGGVEPENVEERWSNLRGQGLGLLFFAGGGAYTPLSHWLGGGATLGKQWLGLRLTTKSGASLGPLRALWRWMTRGLMLFLWPLELARLGLRPNRPTLADLLAGTVLVPSLPSDDEGTGVGFRIVAFAVNAALGFACLWTLSQ